MRKAEATAPPKNFLSDPPSLEIGEDEDPIDDKPSRLCRDAVAMY